MDTLNKNKKTGESPLFLSVSKRAGKAIGDFDMIQEGDRIAVAVSGGKDSISLLHILRHRQKIAPIDFEFAAVHIDFEFADFNPTRLLTYFDEHQFPYILEKVESLKGEKW